MQNLDLLEPHNLIPNGVWSFDDIIRYGEEHKQCPYFTARRMVSTHIVSCLVLRMLLLMRCPDAIL